MGKQAQLTLFALFGFGWWFYGNAYEAIVIAPNWVHDSASQVARLRAFFVHTSPTNYFVPLTQLATLLVWVITCRNREPAAARPLRLASVFAALAAGLNVVIVTTLVLRIFDAGETLAPEIVHRLTLTWNMLNGVRMALTGVTIVALFQAFRQLDRQALERTNAG
jgi:sterol desaturase/sphingolipid hydroxylase (fatty acid hydroxylase superfamily)